MEILDEAGNRKFEVPIGSDGLWEGEARWYFEGGSLQKTVFYQQGIPQGPFEIYSSPEHLQRKGTYQDGRETGWIQIFHFLPELEEVVVEREGAYRIYDYKVDTVSRQEGFWRFYAENGTLVREGAYLEDMENGLWKEWWPNGNQRSAGVFGFCYQEYAPGAPPLLSTRKEGEWTYWDKNGKLEKKEVYRVGVLDQITTDF